MPEHFKIKAVSFTGYVKYLADEEAGTRGAPPPLPKKVQRRILE